ncbi:MAG: ABC transporter permease [Acetobacteraceae bacterium]|nr:ABC transporter permease [Acetobacteraceae bacterium]
MSVRNRTLIAGATITLLVLLAVTVGSALSPYSATEMDFIDVLQPPSLSHLMGTDSFGRDVLTRVLAGARISLLISFAGVALATAAGTLAGMTAAWQGGAAETALMALVDLLFAFPSFVLALFLMVVLGYGIHDVAIAIALVYFPIFARLARNLTVLLREEPYIQAARLIGERPAAILAREILPNILSAIVVQASVGVAFGVVIEAGLSFLGLGVQPPTPSLGVIMADGREYFDKAPWVLTLTGVAVSFALLGLNLLGDGLRDVADPKLREALPR